jgi:hypothetical protein
MEKVKFPSFSVNVVFFVYPGFCFESFTLLALKDANRIEKLVGSLGTLTAVGFLGFVQYWGTLAGRNRDLLFVTYRRYTVAYAAMPQALRKLLPEGYWRGNTPLIARFGALYEQFGDTHISWISGSHLLKALLTAVLATIQPAPEKCRILYLCMTAYFWLFAAFFLAVRPHRRPFDDFISFFVSLLTGMMTLKFAEPERVHYDAVLIYRILIWSAVGSVPITLITAALEWAKWRRVEEAAIEAENTTAAEGEDCAATDQRGTQVDVRGDAAQGVEAEKGDGAEGEGHDNGTAADIGVEDLES